MLNKRSYLTLLLVSGLLAFGAGIGTWTSRYYQPDPGHENIEGFFWPEPKQIGAFSVIDHHGNEFSLEDLRGKWSFLFFGYTYCPDICPVTMSVLNQFYKTLEPQESAETQTLFVTVDPQRDTTGRLANYMGYFNPDFTGLGGTPEQINSLASQIGIVYLYGEPSADGNYLVDHSSSVFLLDPRARLVSIFSAPHDPKVIYKRFTRIREFMSRLKNDS